MVLQKLLLPNEKNCNEQALYFRGSNFEIINNRVKLKKNGFIATDTYFNSFSISKWRKYSIVDNYAIEMQISGICEISLCYAWIDEKNIIRRWGDNKVFYKKEKRGREFLKFDLPECKNGVIAYFSIKADEENVFVYSCEYITKEDIVPAASINIAIGICTYKREDFVYRNIEEIKRKILDNPASPAYGHVEILIADNGQTLGRDKIENEKIHLFANRNYGGSGGFTRCMIETLRLKDENKFSHIILMDDDILLDCDAIDRTYIFLSVLKEEYKSAMIGGGMLVLSEKYRQFESAALYYHGDLSFTQKNVDLRTIRNVISNEQYRDNNYNAWCYCCMPLSAIREDNLPLPLFIHMDDVEYGVRNKFNVITLNGISVWHPFFSNQRGAHIVYYDVRNKLIVMSELGGVDIRDYALRYLQMFYKSIFNYDYERTIMACKAIEDFCKGIDYFKTIEPLELNNTLLKVNKKWLDADEKIKQKITKPYPAEISRKALMKSYFMPHKKKRVVMDCNISDAYPSGIRELVIYNPTTDKYCIYEKSFVKMLKAKYECKKAKKLIDKKILDVSFEWKDRLREVTSLDYWNNYLGLEKK